VYHHANYIKKLQDSINSLKYNHTKKKKEILIKPKINNKMKKIWEYGGFGFLNPNKKDKQYLILKTMKIKPQIKKKKRNIFCF
jgi:phage pi2 protein 07